MTNFGKNRLFHNNHDGTFTDVAEKAGVTLGNWSTGATFGDYDGDGRLDLFVPGYVHFDIDQSGAGLAGRSFFYLRIPSFDSLPRISEAFAQIGSATPTRYLSVESGFVLPVSRNAQKLSTKQDIAGPANACRLGCRCLPPVRTNSDTW